MFFGSRCWRCTGSGIIPDPWSEYMTMPCPDCAGTGDVRLSWEEGAKGALILLYAPGDGPHTEEAYLCHLAAYTEQMGLPNSAYCEAADAVALAADALTQRAYMRAQEHAARACEALGLSSMLHPEAAAMADKCARAIRALSLERDR